jgi:hypothetical protein
MSAFGLNRHTRAFGAAIKNAGGARLTNKNLEIIEMLVVDLWAWMGLSQPLNTIFRFIYPFIGGSAIAHSFNLADPSVGRITWNGTLTHNANGVTGSSDAEGATGVTLGGTALGDNYVCIGVYSRTNSAVDTCELSSGDEYPITISCKESSGSGRFKSGGTATPATLAILINVTDSRGLFTNYRSGAAFLYAYRNGVVLTSNTGTCTGAAVGGISEFALFYDPDDVAAPAHSSRNLALVFLTNPSTAVLPKQAELYTVVQNFQTRLGRQV